MQPINGATYKKHKSLCRERSWIRQFVAEGSNNQWVGKDVNQNMDGWQRLNPCQENGQQPILRKEEQPISSSPIEITPVTGYANCSRRPCFPHGVSLTKPLKLKAIPRTQTTRVATHQTGRPRPEDYNEVRQPTLNDMPNEVLKNIISYLTFKERLRVGWTNTSLRALPMIPGFWRLVKIHDTMLSCTLITTVIKMGTKQLIIPRCSIQGNWLEVYGLGAPTRIQRDQCKLTRPWNPSREHILARAVGLPPSFLKTSIASRNQPRQPPHKPIYHKQHLQQYCARSYKCHVQSFSPTFFFVEFNDGRYTS